MRYAIINDGVVENVIVADEGFTIPGKLLVPTETAGPGWSYNGGEFTPPPVPTPTADDVDAERDRRIAIGFVFNGKLFQTRPDDRENIAGASTAALAAIINGASEGDLRWHGGDSDFTWIAEDNSEVPMDAQTMFAFGQAAMAHKQTLIFKARALKNMTPIPSDYADDHWW